MFVSPHITNSIERAKSLGVSAAVLATLCGTSPAQLSNANRGLKSLGGERELRLSQTSILLVELAEAIKPLHLPDSVDDLRRLVDFVTMSGISMEHIREHVNAIFGRDSA